MSIFRYKKSVYARDFVTPSSCCGSEEIPKYKLDYPPTGGVRLVQIGTIPLHKQIQANKSNCDLTTVLEHCVHQNQLAITSAEHLNSAIADFSGFSNMAEIFSGMKHLEQVWSDTPIEVREQFNSSKAAFVNAIGTPEFNSKVQTGYHKYFKSVKSRLDKKVIVEPAPAPEPASAPEPAPAPTE